MYLKCIINSDNSLKGYIFAERTILFKYILGNSTKLVT